MNRWIWFNYTPPPFSYTQALPIHVWLSQSVLCIFLLFLATPLTKIPVKIFLRQLVACRGSPVPCLICPVSLRATWMTTLAWTECTTRAPSSQWDRQPTSPTNRCCGNVEVGLPFTTSSRRRQLSGTRRNGVLKKKDKSAKVRQLIKFYTRVSSKSNTMINSSARALLLLTLPLCSHQQLSSTVPANESFRTAKESQPVVFTDRSAV